MLISCRKSSAFFLVLFWKVLATRSRWIRHSTMIHLIKQISHIQGDNRHKLLSFCLALQTQTWSTGFSGLIQLNYSHFPTMPASGRAKIAAEMFHHISQIYDWAHQREDRMEIWCKRTAENINHVDWLPRKAQLGWIQIQIQDTKQHLCRKLRERKS